MCRGVQLNYFFTEKTKRTPHLDRCLHRQGMILFTCCATCLFTCDLGVTIMFLLFLCIKIDIKLHIFSAFFSYSSFYNIKRDALIIKCSDYHLESNSRCTVLFYFQPQRFIVLYHQSTSIHNVSPCSILVLTTYYIYTYYHFPANTGCTFHPQGGTTCP